MTSQSKKHKLFRKQLDRVYRKCKKKLHKAYRKYLGTDISFLEGQNPRWITKKRFVVMTNHGDEYETQKCHLDKSTWCGLCMTDKNLLEYFTD